MKGEQQFVQLSQIQKVITQLFLNKDNTLNEDGIETDVEFSDRVIFFKDRREKMNQQLFVQRSDLSQQEYEMVDEIGNLHYLCQLPNESSSKDLSKWPKQKKCICGCKKAAGENLPYCTDEQEATFFGPGVILFFFYSKRILILLISAILVYGIYSVVTNALGNQFSHDCQLSPNGLPFLCQWIRAASIKNKSEESLVMVQVWLAVPMCFIWAVGIRLIRNKGRRLNQKIDDKLDSSSDFCIWIENLPSGQYHEEELGKYLQKLWRIRKKKQPNGPRFMIKSIQIIYNMSEMQAIINKINKTVEEIFYMYQKPVLKMKGQEGKEKKEDEPEKRRMKVKNQLIAKYKLAKKQLGNLQKELKQFRKNFLESSEFRQKIAHETAIIECEHQKNCDELLFNYGKFQESKFKELKDYLLSFCIPPAESQTFKGVNPRLLRAPEPSDINWVNAAQKQSYLRILAVWGINLLLIGSSFGCLMLFRYLSQISDTLKSAAFIKIIILNLFNRLIWNILNKVIGIQQNKTKSEQIASVINKSYLGQSCNVIVLPMIMNLAFADNLYGSNGLSGAVHDFQITVFLFMLLFNLINVPHRTIQFLMCFPCTRKMLIKYYCQITGQLDSLEEIRQALKNLYEPPKLPLAGFYVYIMTVTNQAFFFCHLQPILLVYLLGNLILFYLVNKYLLFKQCKIPELLDFFIFETMIVFAMNVPLFYVIGSTTLLALGGETEFLYYLPGIICFIIWFLCSQNPFSIFSKFILCLENCCIRNEAPIHNIDFSNQIINSTTIKILDDINQKNQEGEDKGDAESIHTNVRRQSYYAGSPMTVLFNFQNQILNFVGPYHDKFKDFCQKFQFNGNNSMMMEDA